MNVKDSQTQNMENTEKIQDTYITIHLLRCNEMQQKG
jgi:hypothetical protein